MATIEIAHRCCAACGSFWLPAGQQLKRCARCHAISYCSRECQKAHWPEHKTICRAPSSTGDTASLRQYATIGCNSDRPEEPDPNTIFYLKTTRAYVHDVSVSGPYYPLGMIVPQILSNIHDSSVGKNAFSDCFLGTEGQGGLGRFESLEAPVDDKPGLSVKIELIRQHNPVMAKLLPGPSYTLVAILCSDTVDPDLFRLTGPLLDFVPTKDIEVHGTYPVSEETEVKRAADRLIANTSKLFARARTDVSGWIDSPEGRMYAASIYVAGREGYQIPKACVMARWDSGFVLKDNSS